MKDSEYSADDIDDKSTTGLIDGSWSGTGSGSDHVLPLRFVMLHSKTANGTILNIGPDDNHPENAVTTSSKLHSTITLHQDSDPNSPPLAIAVNRWQNGTTINVSLAASDTSPAVNVQLHGRYKLTNYAFTFEMAIGVGGAMEKFEWRSTRRAEIHDIGHKHGWKLIHLGHSGEEAIVALWSTSYTSRRLGGEFAFAGDGARDEFGDQWASMAVVTALSIGTFMRGMGGSLAIA